MFLPYSLGLLRTLWMHENTDGLTSYQTLLGLSVYTRSKRQVSLHTLPVVSKLLFDHEPSYLSHYAWSRSKRRKYPDFGSRVGKVFSTSIPQLVAKRRTNFAPSSHHLQSYLRNAMYSPERAKLPCLRKFMPSKDGLTLSLSMRTLLGKEVLPSQSEHGSKGPSKPYSGM